MTQISNQVRLIGYTGAETQFKTLDSGQHMANISLATKEYYRDKEGNKKDRTEWHRIVAWGKVAENMNQLVTKGDQMAVEGKLTHRSYEKDGETHYTTEVVVSDFVLLSKQEK